MLWTWAVLSGAEVTPFTGSFELPGGVRGHLSFVVNVGLGAGGTRIPLSSASANGPATFGDTGVKFMGAAGAGFRVGLGRHVALRLEARNVMYSSAVESINGCSLSDMGLDDRNSRFRQIPAISQSCAAGGFRADSDSNDYQARESAARDARYAGSLLLQRSSDIAFNLGLYAGISFLF